MYEGTRKHENMIKDSVGKLLRVRSKFELNQFFTIDRRCNWDQILSKYVDEIRAGNAPSNGFVVYELLARSSRVPEFNPFLNAAKTFIADDTKARTISEVRKKIGVAVANHGIEFNESVFDFVVNIIQRLPKQTRDLGKDMGSSLEDVKKRRRL